MNNPLLISGVDSTRLATTTTTATDRDSIISSSLARFPPNTRRAYTRHLTSFSSGLYPLSRAGIHSFIRDLELAGKSPQSIHQALAATKHLALEFYERSIIDISHYTAIKSIHPPKIKSTRLGRWLNIEQCRALLGAGETPPAPSSLTTTRDRALLSLMLGCGLRRSEISALSWHHIQTRESRTIIADLKGKGSKLRSIAIPSWASNYLQAWRDALQVVQTATKRILIDPSNPIFRSIEGQFPHNRLSESGVWWVVRENAKRAGLEVTPHDLRRTFAYLAKVGGADLKLIQEALGHSSVRTTEIYVGKLGGWKLGEAAGDKIGL